MRPKDKPSRNLPPVDYKAMHEGSGQEITGGVRPVEASTSLSLGTAGRRDAGEFLLQQQEILISGAHRKDIQILIKKLKSLKICSKK